MHDRSKGGGSFPDVPGAEKKPEYIPQNMWALRFDALRCYLEQQLDNVKGIKEVIIERPLKDTTWQYNSLAMTTPQTDDRITLNGKDTEQQIKERFLHPERMYRCVCCMLRRGHCAPFATMALEAAPPLSLAGLLLSFGWSPSEDPHVLYNHRDRQIEMEEASPSRTETWNPRVKRPSAPSKDWD
ncbi:uncharacterized protein GJ701_003376 [Geothlypis trichas]